MRIYFSKKHLQLILPILIITILSFLIPWSCAEPSLKFEGGSKSKESENKKFESKNSSNNMEDATGDADYNELKPDKGSSLGTNSVSNTYYNKDMNRRLKLVIWLDSSNYLNLSLRNERKYPIIGWKLYKTYVKSYTVYLTVTFPDSTQVPFNWNAWEDELYNIEARQEQLCPNCTISSVSWKIYQRGIGKTVVLQYP